ncbi:MAG: ABC transporter substrate binding protein [Pseudomonadota bacterium]
MVRAFRLGHRSAHGSSRWCALLAAALLFAGQPCARATGVLVVASSSADLYSRFIERFTADLAAAPGGTPAIDVSVDYLDAAAITDAQLKAADMIVTIGTSAAREIAAHAHTAPVLYTILPESVYRTLPDAAAGCARQSAIYIDQPLARQAALARLMFPAAASYGLLLGPTSDQRRAEVEALTANSDRRIIARSTGPEPNISVAANGLLHEADLLLAVNDPLVLNRENAKWLLYSAYQRRLPVIGFSQAYVKAGAAGAVYSEPEQMARQAAEIVLERAGRPGKCMPAAAFPAYFSIAVNQSVCSSLGGSVCDEQRLDERMINEGSRP